MTAPVSSSVLALDEVAGILAKPENWTKKASARDGQRVVCRVDDPGAVCWCLSGALLLATSKLKICNGRISKALDKFSPGGDFIDFNDDTGTTHSQVLEVVRKAREHLLDRS